MVEVVAPRVSLLWVYSGNGMRAAVAMWIQAAGSGESGKSVLQCKAPAGLEAGSRTHCGTWPESIALPVMAMARPLRVARMAPWQRWLCGGPIVSGWASNWVLPVDMSAKAALSWARET